MDQPRKRYKIGIITFASAHNFGTSLQSWAMQTLLESRGHDVEIINYRLPSIDRTYELLPGRAPKSRAGRMLRRVRVAKRALERPFAVVRRRRFERFFTQYHKLTVPYRSTAELRRAGLDHDILIAGSDQIWNFRIVKRFDPAFFADFGRDDAIRVAYAASFGESELPEREKPMFRNYLRRMDHISVREHSAQAEIQALTEKPVSVTLDPTLLLPRADYDKLRRDVAPKGDYIYVHIHHHTGKGPDLVKVAERVSRETGLPVVHNIIGYKFNNELGNSRSAGPGEVLGYIAGAKYVVTQSFHATVFSLIYRKNFLTVLRDRNSERFVSLLELLGLSGHLVTDFDNPPDIRSIEIDYDDVEPKLKEAQRASFGFIDEFLTQGKAEKEPDYFQHGDKFACYGCSLCKDICPTDAITMVSDEEGFRYPKIDDDLCIHCNRCSDNCIYNKKNRDEHDDPKMYAAYSTVPGDRRGSASGAIYPLLYRQTLRQGGCVAGVRWDDNLNAIYDLACDEQGCDAFRGSKYMQPEHNDIFRRVKETLEQGKPLLFVGSPCKITGLRNYLGRAYENLTIAEIICSGVTPNKAFRRYLDSVGQRQGSPVASYAFRDKVFGTAARTTRIELKNGNVIQRKRREEPYYNAFLSNYLLRPACYACEFTGNTDVADLTLGDFWGANDVFPGIDDDRGISCVKVNTPKGQALFDAIKPDLVWRETTVDAVYRRNHSRPNDMPPVRSDVFAGLDSEDTFAALTAVNRSALPQDKRAAVDRAALQRQKIAVLYHLDAFCRERRIRYYLDYKTTLAALRFHRPIAGETAIGVLLRREDYDKLLRSLPGGPAKGAPIPISSALLLQDGKLTVDKKAKPGRGNYRATISVHALDGVADSWSREQQLRSYRIKLNRYLLLCRQGVLNPRGTKGKVLRLAARFTTVAGSLKRLDRLYRKGSQQDSPFLVCWGAGPDHRKLTMPADWYGKPSRQTFAHSQYAVPHATRSVLERIFGKGWDELATSEIRKKGGRYL